MITDEMEHFAEAAGVKLEYVNGIPIWEASPVIRHQRIVDRVRASIRSHVDDAECGCVHYADIYIMFPDGSLKRPDISIFCEEPLDDETVCRTIPEVAIEILSKGYEKKDTEIGLPFYLANGVRDVAIFDPADNRVRHYHDGTIDEHASPVDLDFSCGCRATI